MFGRPGEFHVYSEGYHEYTGGVQYTGDIMSTLEGYHDKCGGRSLGKQLNLYGNPSVLNISRCTHDIPHTHHGIPSVYSWYPLTGLNNPRIYCTDIMQLAVGFLISCLLPIIQTIS